MFTECRSAGPYVVARNSLTDKIIANQNIAGETSGTVMKTQWGDAALYRNLVQYPKLISGGLTSAFCTVVVNVPNRHDNSAI
jgi:hypothetical protein